MAFRSVLLAAALALAIPAQAREFRSAEVHPGDYPTTEAVRYMGKLIAEQTKNKHSIPAYPNGALGTE